MNIIQQSKASNRQPHNEEVLMYLADNMAAAAASFSSHGYDQFIQARDSFKNALRENACIVESVNIE